MKLFGRLLQTHNFPRSLQKLLLGVLDGEPLGVFDGVLLGDFVGDTVGLYQHSGASSDHRPEERHTSWKSAPMFSWKPSSQLTNRTSNNDIWKTQAQLWSFGIALQNKSGTSLNLRNFTWVWNVLGKRKTCVLEQNAFSQKTVKYTNVATDPVCRSVNSFSGSEYETVPESKLRKDPDEVCAAYVISGQLERVQVPRESLQEPVEQVADSSKKTFFHQWLAACCGNPENVWLNRSSRSSCYYFDTTATGV